MRKKYVWTDYLSDEMICFDFGVCYDVPFLGVGRFNERCGLIGSGFLTKLYFSNRGKYILGRLLEQGQCKTLVFI